MTTIQLCSQSGEMKLNNQSIQSHIIGSFPLHSKKVVQSLEKKSASEPSVPSTKINCEINVASYVSGQCSKYLCMFSLSAVHKRSHGVLVTIRPDISINLSDVKQCLSNGSQSCKHTNQ